MKLYSVTLEIDMNVIAADEGAAVETARNHVRDEMKTSLRPVRVMLGRAPGWKYHEIPWCDVPGGNPLGALREWPTPSQAGEPK